jgi:cysteine desulfurase
MQRIYLDANATTPVLPEVVEAMLPYLTTGFGNPSSAHQSGQRTRSAVEHARACVARMLHCAAKEIVFTSGGTESDNLALFGVLQSYLDQNEPAHLITTQIEHHAILYTAQALEARGIEVTYLAPNADGIIDPAAFEAALKPHTRLVSIMLANNETGAIQPLGKLARIAKAFNPAILIHTDAVQAASKLSLDLTLDLKNIDLLSLSGHKMYAPQGTGILFVRKGVQLTPLFHGGPHERQRRAGTENVPGIVALGRASEIAVEYLASTLQESVIENSKDAIGLIEFCHPERSEGPAFVAATAAQGTISSGETCSSSATTLSQRRDRLEAGLLATIPDIHINGSITHRAPNTTNLRFAGVDAESLLIALDMQGISASFGAACQSGATEPSHVLLAMGLTPAEARSSLRLSLSRLTTEAEIDHTLEIIPAAVARLRSLR